MKYPCHMSAVSLQVERIAAGIDEVFPFDQALGHCSCENGIPDVNARVENGDPDPAYRGISAQRLQDILAICVES
jgi:hypothetical protein